MAGQLALALEAIPLGSCRQRGISSLQRLFRVHFADFTSYANIEYVGGESRCPAVAWPLSAEEVADLDVPEGATGKDGTFDYYRIGMPFVMKAGARLCHVYIANPDRLQRPAPPAAHYRDHFRLGCEEFGLDSRHLEEALARASHPTNLLFGDSVRCKEQP